MWGLPHPPICYKPRLTAWIPAASELELSWPSGLLPGACAVCPLPTLHFPKENELRAQGATLCEHLKQSPALSWMEPL